MAQDSHALPRTALLILAVLVVVILIAVDLTSQNSILISLWDTLNHGQTQGERARDEFIQQLKARR